MFTAFVTGCSSGFGHGLALRLLREGHRVVATSPELGPWADALRATGGELLVAALDIRSSAAVEEVTSRALAWGAVDVLVNNAGRGFFATQEEGSLDTFRDLVDVNVFGVVR